MKKFFHRYLGKLYFHFGNSKTSKDENFFNSQGIDTDTGKLTPNQNLIFTNIGGNNFTVHIDITEARKKMPVQSFDLMMPDKAMLELYNWLGMRLNALNHHQEFLLKYPDKPVAANIKTEKSRK